MAMSAPRASVFTFESTVHSSHVLRCLDDQRRRDVMCDVTVVVEGQSFRAHRSVLASCSEYFTHRISSLTQHGAVLTLPQEVTAAGFEPLLKFAYTSKLLFGKDNVLEIRNSSSVLGFRDLDEACFEFLLPKFFSSTKGSALCPRKTCCKKKRQLSKTGSCTDSDAVLLEEKEVKPVDYSPSQQEVARPCEKSEGSKLGSQKSTATLAAAAEGANDGFMRCPKYRKFQLACGKGACAAEKRLTPAIRDECGLSCSPCSSSANSKNETERTNPARLRDNGADQRRTTEIHEKTIDVGSGEAEKNTNEREGDIMKMEEEMEQAARVSSRDRSSVEAVSVGESTRLAERSPGLILHHCPLRASAEAPVITRSQGQERFVMDLKDDNKTRESGGEEPVSILQRAEEQAETEGERGIMDRATLPANNTREGSPVGSDEGSSDPDAGRSSNTGSGQLQATSENWVKLHVNLSSSSSDCPFLQDLDQSKCLWKGAGLSECASHSGVSSLNSGEDGDSETETEGDSEAYTRERARQVQLPFSVDCIVNLSRNEFQQLLKQQVFTQEQLEFVHDMRRRSKNRLAAQRCRKRKLDCIHNLQCEINKLKTEREKLMVEKSHLSQMKVTARHSVSVLCHRVCSEAHLQPEQLQVLAKYMPPDCPLTSLFPHIDALLSQSGLPLQPPASEEDWCRSGRDTVTGDGTNIHHRH
ncbi:transcription regulator protein BACH1b [Hippoglossus stenolepis]|uniref:transcription regulator protein BACH1b n=1 Tax=Hippoglossus stenolepis TaxID=195615 RepID=UPI00159C0FF8|nr:transcription regulator protein BACH1b [Hippoglossus stenolepis]XP_035035376.1 transcription regulator protein BACH1b [Hippoglossus stenolepis]